MQIERSFRGISARLARHYLANLGGEIKDDETVEGANWQASLSAETVAIGPSIELTEVTVVFDGPEEALEPLVERFAQKAMRAGG
ncbi:MoaD-like protein [Halanaeroarchaeum sp. HSR-CO]|uniref:hypothetical protein n=1 Tax=Halanaeroarchaeum sp. HSR-CO TaxID=2866382 RepID=UPI00217F1F5B|nr:hypothetical protein [Halanaeroarchaeum sp. HSR-CO]UWG48855.1 MoaD-like protein [Halanaeroarchaeum sp. HSR-CO]